jgi:multidrug efflux pump subunit AcrA (membrane-fusion protein)
VSTKRKVIAAVAAVLVVAGGTVALRAGGGGSGDEEVVIVPQEVSRRTLQDVLTVDGELRREELRKINSPVDGRVSEVFVEDGDEVTVGDTLFALDGRAAVAVPGDFSFFRALDVGSDGPDVLQLERILDDSGYDPGRVDRLFTEQTRAALAEWQVEHGYGGATPEPDEVVTVSLQSNSAGYEVGKANTVAITIGPTVPSASGAALAGGPPSAVPAVARGAALVRPAAGTPDKPIINVSVSPAEVDEGGSVTFTFTSDPAPAASTTVDLTIDGDADGGEDAEDADYEEIADSVVFPAGKTTHRITVRTFVDDVVEEDEDITVGLSDQFGNDPNYVVGPSSEATATIRANGEDLVPELTITADTEVVAEDETASITIESTVELNRDLDIVIEGSGSATSGDDFVELDEEVTLTAGDTEVSFDVQARADDDVEPDEHLTVRIGAGSGYVVGSPGEVTVTITSDNVPEMNLIGGGRVSEGGTASFLIVSDQPVVEDTSVNYQVSGSADPGTDFEALPGTVIMPAGASSVEVPVRTLDDDVVFQPSDMLVADWPARVGVVEVDEGEFMLQGDVLLTLTEPAFTVTMSLSPSDRSEVEIGMEVEVELAAGGQEEVPGVITELDDTATVTGEGDNATESYEGVIEVTEELAGVDGASVTIDVTLDERVDVLAVPVAAVLSSGGGQQVRIVDEDDGTIERVDVEVGLVDDEFVEIVDGLDGDEFVIVSVDADASDGESPSP